MKEKINTEECSEVGGDHVVAGQYLQGSDRQKEGFTLAAGREIVI